MKSLLHILILAILIALYSCGQSNDRKNINVVKTDTLLTDIDKKEKEYLEKRREVEEQAHLDSLMFDKVLIEALIISNQNIEKGKFQKEYEARPSDEYNVQVEISLDNHFTKLYPHLIIRMHGQTNVYINIYAKTDKGFQNVVSHDEWTMSYMNDTIRDINGDGRKDFVVNWYGMNGCCLKAFSNVYLLRQDQKRFSENFEFINPTFSPKEKVIRGVCYGHPGETEMYKYKWNGEKVDTLEYVSYQRNENGKTGKIILSTGSPYDNKSRILKTLNSVPAEYKKIEGYGWFTGEF